MLSIYADGYDPLGDPSQPLTRIDARGCWMAADVAGMERMGKGSMMLGLGSHRY